MSNGFQRTSGAERFHGDPTSIRLPGPFGGGSKRWEPEEPRQSLRRRGAYHLGALAHQGADAPRSPTKGRNTALAIGGPLGRRTAVALGTLGLASSSARAVGFRLLRR